MGTSNLYAPPNVHFGMTYFCSFKRVSCARAVNELTLNLILAGDFNLKNDCEQWIVSSRSCSEMFSTLKPSSFDGSWLMLVVDRDS